MLNDDEKRPVRSVAVIPARGGSKGIPGKNLAPVGGTPLLERAIRSCLGVPAIDAVYVSTDDPAIAELAESCGAGVIERPSELAGDQAASEDALLHALDTLAIREIRPTVLAFVQCTSPFIPLECLDDAVRLVQNRRADTVFSATASHAFLWRPRSSAAGEASVAVVGVNHDEAAPRQRRQDRPPEYRETGAFYVMTVAGLRAHRSRFFGRTKCVLVPELSAIEIDTPPDLRLADALAPLLDSPPQPLEVDAVITDFDGVHTDDSALVDQFGCETVRVSRADGLGIERLRRLGVPILIVSKELNPVVTARAAKLGVDVQQGVEDKVVAVRDWLDGLGIRPEHAAYLGNDINDLAVMSTVGWPAAVSDARPEVRRAARIVLTRPGGDGAVRELCDHVIAARSERSATYGPATRAAARGDALRLAAVAGLAVGPTADGEAG
jgi:YrbI family 3-deoxy-D-manno-octulosonate 8-phosphate phosphatase